MRSTRTQAGVSNQQMLPVASSELRSLDQHAALFTCSWPNSSQVITKHPQPLFLGDRFCVEADELEEDY